MPVSLVGAGLHVCQPSNFRRLIYPPCIFGCFCQIVWPIGLSTPIRKPTEAVCITGLVIFSYRFFTSVALAMRGYYSHDRVSVCVCVCVSHAGIVSKRRNVGSRKQHHVIAQGLYFSGGRWIRGSGKRGSGNRGTIMQGWKSREWNSRHQTSGLENAEVKISGEEKVWKAKR